MYAIIIYIYKNSLCLYYEKNKLKLLLSKDILDFIKQLIYLIYRQMYLHFQKYHFLHQFMRLITSRNKILDYAIKMQQLSLYSLFHYEIPFFYILKIYDTIKKKLSLEQKDESHIEKFVKDIKGRYLDLLHNYKFINMSLTLQSENKKLNLYLKKKTYRLIFDFYREHKHLKYLYNLKKEKNLTFKITSLNSDIFENILIQKIFYDTFNFIEYYKNIAYFDDISIILIKFNVIKK